jgi:type I restriction enzyme M protein
LVNIRDWCKNDFEVVHQLRINTDYGHHRYDVILLINGVPVAQVELKTLGVSPRRAMQQIADYKADPGNGYLKDQGAMAIILPHGVLFRGGAEERIRTKLLKDGHIDTVIGLPANLFYSTGIPVCILVLKKCKKPDDVLFINAAEHYAKDKRQNRLREGKNGEPDDIEKIVSTYRERREEDRYSKRVPMSRIEAEGYNLNISRYISTAVAEEEIDLHATHAQLLKTEERILDATARHNAFLKQLNLPPLPPNAGRQSK